MAIGGGGDMDIEVGRNRGQHGGYICNGELTKGKE